MKSILSKLVFVKPFFRIKSTENKTVATSIIQLDYRLFNQYFRKNTYSKHQYSEFIEVGICHETHKKLQLKKSQELLLDFAENPKNETSCIVLKTIDNHRVGYLPKVYADLVYEEIQRGYIFNCIVSLLEQENKHQVVWIDLDAYKPL